jgi:superfamily II DNA or RNA helicase
MFEITPFRHGDVVRVNRSHILSLKLTNTGGRVTGPDGHIYCSGDVANVSVDQLLAASKTFRSVAKLYRVAIDFSSHVELDPDLPPYLLGIWLADGDAVHPSVTTPEPEVKQYLTTYADEVGVRVRATAGHGCEHLTVARERRLQNGWGQPPNPFTTALRRHNLIGNKHIPFAFKTASRADRAELLAGFLDGDGYLNYTHYDVVCKSRLLADDIVSLARSLGLGVSVTPCRKGIATSGFVGAYYRLRICGRTDELPLIVPRKQAPEGPRHKNISLSGFSLHSVGIDDYFGFELAGPDRLFVLGDFTVTHNSVLLAMLATTLSARGRRVLAHRKELLEQNSGVLRRIAPDLDVGICAANLKCDNTDARVVIGSTPTIYRRLDRIGSVDVILLDEAHLMGPASTTMLARICERLGDPPLVGVTATGFRTDSASLVDAGIFDAVVHETTLSDALAAGLLCPPVTKAPRAGRIDLSNVPIVAGEFHAASLEAAAMAGDVTAQAVAGTVEIARSEQRQSWLVFASGVAHAHQIATELDRHGISRAVITGETPIEIRTDAIARFRSGRLTALVNCNVLTTGFDATGIDLIAFMRATCSPVLWVQSAGRGMRVHLGKENCRMLDFGSNILRHGPIDNVTLRKTGERHDTERAAARIRICPYCEELNAAAAVVCSACGEQLIKVRTPKIIEVASELEVIGGRQPGDWTRVTAMVGRIHCKPGSPPSYRIAYHTDRGWVSDYLPLQHSSPGARWHAGKKWGQLSRDQLRQPPLSAAEADVRFRSGELRRPLRLLVERDGSWWRVRGAEFAA